MKRLGALLLIVAALAAPSVASAASGNDDGSDGSDTTSELSVYMGMFYAGGLLPAPYALSGIFYPTLGMNLVLGDLSIGIDTPIPLLFVDALSEVGSLSNNDSFPIMSAINGGRSSRYIPLFDLDLAFKLLDRDAWSVHAVMRTALASFDLRYAEPVTAPSCNASSFDNESFCNDLSVSVGARGTWQAAQTRLDLFALGGLSFNELSAGNPQLMARAALRHRFTRQLGVLLDGQLTARQQRQQLRGVFDPEMPAGGARWWALGRLLLAVELYD